MQLAGCNVYFAEAAADDDNGDDDACVCVKCSTRMSVGAFLIEELCVHSTVRACVSLFLPSSPRAPPPSRVTSA